MNDRFASLFAIISSPHYQNHYTRVSVYNYIELTLPKSLYSPLPDLPHSRFAAFLSRCFAYRFSWCSFSPFCLRLPILLGDPTPPDDLTSDLTPQQDDATDALRCQLEAYKNEAELVRHEHREELDAKDSEMNIMRKTMQNVQQVGGQDDGRGGWEDGYD